VYHAATSDALRTALVWARRQRRSLQTAETRQRREWTAVTRNDNRAGIATDVPRPPERLGTVLAGRIAFTVVYSALFANVLWLMPLLVRLRFGAVDSYWRDWQTTLVGVRGVAFQGTGMALYRTTGNSVWPLGLAALAFLWAAMQMRQLHSTAGRGKSGPAGASSPCAKD
jgi:hypothetical protein